MSDQLTVAQLDEQLKDLVEWERFALHLEGISAIDVDIIKRDHPQQVINQRTALFDKWLRVCPKPTWDKVILALETVDENRIAQRIKGQLPTYTCESGCLTTQQQAASTCSGQHLSDQGESMSVPQTSSTEVTINKDTVEELSSLYNSFAKVSFKCVKEFRTQVNTGRLDLMDIVTRIKQESAYNFDALNGVKSIDSFFDVVSLHYHFLNCHLLVALVEEFLQSELLDQLTSHVRNVNTFKKNVKVRALKRQLSRFITKSPHEAPVTVRANDAWEESELNAVEVLLQSLFRLTHTDLLKIFRVVPGSLLIVVLAPHHITMSLITHSKHMIQFMRLTGIISLQVGETYVLQDKENGNYTFENGLIQSVQARNYEAVRFLLEQAHVNVNVQIHGENTTALKLACLRNDIAMVELLLEKNADPNQKAEDGVTPLFIGSRFGHLEVVERILQANANPNAPRDDGATPLFIASQNGYIEIVEKLLKANANPECSLNNGATPLYIASQEGHFGIVERLLHTKADPNAPKNDGTAPLHIACTKGHPKVVEKLLQANASPNSPLNNGITPLFIASRNGYLKVVEKLLWSKVNPDTPADNGATPLFIASQNGHLEVVERLLQANADPGSSLNNGITPLFAASLKGHLEVVERLLKAKANPDSPRDDGATPLHVASQNGHLEVVERLLEANVNPNTPMDEGITPLFIACQNGHLKVMESLLKAKANPDISVDDGATPLFISSQNGHLEVVERLLQANTSPDIPKNNGVTPLFIASQYGHLQIVEKLLQANTDPEYPRNDGMTPLSIANRKGHSKIVKLLQAKINLETSDRTSLSVASRPM